MNMKYTIEYFSAILFLRNFVRAPSDGRASSSTTFLEAASTCDDSYYDDGKACVWRTFLCDEYNNTGVIPASLQTCFSGPQQSPINLDVSQAIVGDPGQINFTGYTDHLGSTQFKQFPFTTLKGFAQRALVGRPFN